MRRRSLIGFLLASVTAGCTGSIDEMVDQLRGNEDTIEFEDKTEDFDFHYSYRTGSGSRVEKISNAGVYISDFNNNGWDDILAIGGDDVVLFENNEGTFTESDALPSLDAEPYSALFFDATNSGWEDLLLLCRNNKMQFLANNEGTFEHLDVGLSVELTDPISAAAADATGNGYPDVFIIQNGDWDRNLPAGYRTYLDDSPDNGAPNLLFKNDGESFTEITGEAGIEGDRWSLATSFMDVTDSGAPDIHIANDFHRDVLYRNEGEGRFERIELGDSTDRNGMASEIADFTGNGTLDIFITNIYYPEEIRKSLGGTLPTRAKGNNLLRYQGDGMFEDVADEFGVRKGGWGWAAVGVDFNNNGYLDLFHATSRDSLSDRRELTADEVTAFHERYPFYRHPALWQGTNDGFTPISASDVGIPEMDSRGIAEIDINNNGSMDVVVADASGQYRVLGNESRGGRAIQIRLTPDSEMTVLGSKVTVSTDEITRIHAADSNTDFFSQGSRTLHFGVGSAERVDIDITWPNNREQRHTDIETNQRLRISPDGIESSMDLS